MSDPAMSQPAMSGDAMMTDPAMSGDTMMKPQQVVGYDDWMQHKDAYTGRKLVALYLGTDSASKTLDDALMKAGDDHMMSDDAMMSDEAMMTGKPSEAKPGETMMGDAMMSTLPADLTVIKVTDADTATMLGLSSPGMATVLDANGKPTASFSVAGLGDLSNAVKGMMG